MLSSCKDNDEITLESVTSEKIITLESINIKNTNTEYIEILKIPNKINDPIDGIYVEKERDIGPYSFALQGDKIFILDGWDGRLLIYENRALCDEISFQYSGYDILVKDYNNFILFSFPYKYGIFEFCDGSFEKISESQLYNDEFKFDEIRISGNYVLINNGSSYLTTDDSFKDIHYHPWSISIENNSIIDHINNKNFSILNSNIYCKIIGKYNDDIYIEVFEDSPVKRYIFVINTMSNDIIKVNIKNMEICVHNDLILSSDGILYQMLFDDKNITINRINYIQ